jgi:hypothetical protein
MLWNNQNETAMLLAKLWVQTHTFSKTNTLIISWTDVLNAWHNLNDSLIQSFRFVSIAPNLLPTILQTYPSPLLPSSPISLSSPFSSCLTSITTNFIWILIFREKHHVFWPEEGSVGLSPKRWIFKANISSCFLF